MICLGSPQAHPSAEDSTVAQLRAVELFRADFLRRHPTGIVLSELEYMGRTTRAPAAPGPVQYRGRGELNRILEALTSDFRRWSREGDYRKCDALGLDGAGRRAELLEVTTDTNVASAVGQIESKLAILRETVNRANDLQVDWQPARWRPSAAQSFYPLRTRATEVRYVCYVPTARRPAPDGVVLYEVHVLERPRVPSGVPLPADVSDPLRNAYRGRERNETTEAWARRFVREHPAAGTALRALAATAGVVVAVTAVLLIFDPVPGDEAAAGMAALSLMSFAMAN